MRRKLYGNNIQPCCEYCAHARRATVGGAPAALPYSVSVSASVMLLLLSFLAMLCFSEKKAGKTKQGVL